MEIWLTNNFIENFHDMGTENMLWQIMNFTLNKFFQLSELIKTNI